MQRNGVHVGYGLTGDWRLNEFAANFSNSAWTGHLGQYEPDAIDAANDLRANTTFRSNAITAGLPANCFVLNPNVTNANITRSIAGTRDNAIQLDLRRHFSKGFLVNANAGDCVRRARCSCSDRSNPAGTCA